MPRFFKWYFALAPVRILVAGRNFLIFGWHFFSIGYFLPRLLQPWHRDVTGYGRGFDLKRIFHVLGWNLISRVIGACLRLAVMFLGFVFEAAAAALTPILFLGWYLLPLISIGFIILGAGRL